MVAIDLVIRRIVENYGPFIHADLMADGRLDLQFATRLQAELNLVVNSTSQPAIFSDPSHGREPHPCRSADDVENARNSLNAGDGL